MSERTEGRMGGWMDERMNGWMEVVALMDGCRDGWVAGWMDE